MDRTFFNDGELIEMKRLSGWTLISVLREAYGPGFADNAGNEQTLDEALPSLAR
jgi:hypothetical protein